MTRTKAKLATAPRPCRTIRLPVLVDAAVENYAFAEERTYSSMCARLVAEACANRDKSKMRRSK